MYWEAISSGNRFGDLGFAGRIEKNERDYWEIGTESKNKKLGC